MTTATKRKPAAKVHEKKTTRPASDVHPDEIPLAWIDPSPFNPRTEFDDADLKRLADSIGEHGLLQPVVVRKVGTRYQLIAGDRRLRAAQRAGRKSIAAVVRDVSDGDALVLGLIENIERQDLNPADTARAVARLCAPESEGGCGMSQVDAGTTLSRDASWVRRQLQLLKLPDVWLKRVAAGTLNASMGHTLVQYADRPAVLARIEDDMLANPWAWRTTDDFERNAKLLADGNGATRKPASASELKPRRAAPGDGERKREPRGGDDSQPSAEAASSTDVADDRDRSTPNIAAANPPRPLADVSQILVAIRQLENVDDLDRVVQAAEGRRRALIEIRA